MTTQHTKGPWHIGEGNGEGSIFADSGRVRFEGGGATLYPIAQVSRGWNDVEDDANARLIAAAPDLLATLQNCVNVLALALPLFDDESNDDKDSRDEVESVVDQARAAIAKATGDAE